MLHVNCLSDCIDMVQQGPRDTNSTPRPTDLPYLEDMLKAMYTGQNFAKNHSVPYCTNSCRQAYPNCSTTNIWYQVYTNLHKTEMSAFNIAIGESCYNLYYLNNNDY